MWQTIQQLLGLSTTDYSTLQMVLRAITVYISTLVIVRIGETRFLGENTAFDAIVGIILGSVVSRAINGDAELLPSLAAGLAIVLLHWVISVLVYHFQLLNRLINGRSQQLVRNGKLQWRIMRQQHVTEDDVLEELRTQGHDDALSDNHDAYLERDGVISVVQHTRVVDIEVKDGVQTVRLKVD
jgi:uncharacterized membrane protein YcaP (DUF421 family)